MNECQVWSQIGNNEPQIWSPLSSGRLPSTSTTKITIPRFTAKNASVSILRELKLYETTFYTSTIFSVCRQCCSGVEPCRVAPCCGLIAAPKTTRRKHQREKEALHARLIAFVFASKGNIDKETETVIFVAPRHIHHSDDSFNTPPFPLILSNRRFSRPISPLPNNVFFFFFNSHH